MTRNVPLPRTPTRKVLLSLLLMLCLAIPGTASANAGVSCDSLNVSLSPNKNYYIFTATASGNNTAITGYTFNFGDSQSYTVTFASSDTQDHHSATVTHTYQNSGSYAPTVQVNTKSGNKTSSVTSPDCQASVTIQPASNTLPNTGANDAPEVFVAASLAGITAYQLYIRHRSVKTTPNR